VGCQKSIGTVTSSFRLTKGYDASSLAYSAMGAHYRHTTPEMANRVADAIQQRLTIVLQVAEQVVTARPTPLLLNRFW
jgi:hypothetical protein